MRRALAVVVAVAALDLAASLTWTPVASILTGSMAPGIDPGDAVVLARLDGPPEVGDVVLVEVPETGRRLGFPDTMVHRIVEIEGDGTIWTQGDARAERDPFPVTAADLDGRVVLRVPRAGFVLRLLGSPPIVLWLLGTGVILGLRRPEEEDEPAAAPLLSIP